MLDRIESGTVTSWSCTRDFYLTSCRASKCKQEAWKNDLSCMLAIVLMPFFFVQLKLSIFLFYPIGHHLQISSTDIIHKSKFDFNRSISISEIILQLIWMRFVLSISPCIVYSIMRRVEKDSPAVRYFVHRPIGNSLTKGREKDEWLPWASLGCSLFVI